MNPTAREAADTTLARGAGNSVAGNVSGLMYRPESEQRARDPAYARVPKASVL